MEQLSEVSDTSQAMEGGGGGSGGRGGSGGGGGSNTDVDREAASVVQSQHDVGGHHSALHEVCGAHLISVLMSEISAFQWSE